MARVKKIEHKRGLALFIFCIILSPEKEIWRDIF